MLSFTWPNFPMTRLANWPTITYEINHKGSVHLAELAPKAGVKRFVYMSSCSVYGVSEGDDVTEESCVSPQTAYAVCKTLVERDVKPLARTLRVQLSRRCRRPPKRFIMKYSMLAILLRTIACARLQRSWAKCFLIAV